MARRIRAMKAKQPVITRETDSSHGHCVSPTLEGELIFQPLSPCDRSPIEITSGDSDPTAEGSNEESDPEPLIRRKSKGKEVAAKPKTKCKSPRSSPSSSRNKAKAAASRAKEEENLKVVNKLIAWSKEAQVELQSPSYGPIKMEGDKLIPYWTISAQSSVLKTHVGQNSWELYKSTLLSRDQALLTPLSRILIEHNLAQSIS
ncbi:UNVERIFIED_CONTAM: hypothetical protein Sindi_1261700 [Sesamum indicum]